MANPPPASLRATDRYREDRHMTDRTPDFVTAGLAYRDRAMKTIAFGASSTPRGRQKPAPIVVARGEGAHLWDVSGTRFIDYAMGYGPLILGHSPAPVIDAVRAELDLGLRTATVHAKEAELGELIAATVPSAEVSALVSSGSEAIQLALRIARAATGRTKIIKFRGNYHGWFDTIQVGGHPGDDGPDTPGQDPEAAASITLCDWGDLEAVRRVLSRDYAAVLLEAVAVNGGCFAPPAGFLEGLRALTRDLGVMLIFDEVITGYRLSLGGAQQLVGVTPDMTVLGKALGGGLPISAVTGSRAAMEPVASARTLHRGTYNGNPVSVGAAVGCVRYLRENAATIYPRMDALGADLQAHIRAEADRFALPLSVTRTGSAMQLFVGQREIAGLNDVALVDREATTELTAELLLNGVQTLNRGLMYLSAAHTEDDIAQTKQAFSAAIAAVTASR